MKIEQARWTEATASNGPAERHAVAAVGFSGDRLRVGYGSLGGWGLGLSISKRFVEMHGGQLLVESEERRGSTFHVVLPRS